MARTVISSATPATVAQRLSDLLLCFPAAAMGGVQWKTLVRKYEERHSTRLDLAALGHSSPLAAMTTLLWEVLRVVDSEDTDNPVVAVEDSAALVPKPGCAASWPSLYQVLCTILREHGTVEEAGGERAILVSQLKPLLQRYWHSTFDEGSLGYLTEEGSPVKLKKMKHLLQALLRWRSQRMAWQKSWEGRVSHGMDEALKLELELVPSKRHNDLLVRFVRPAAQSLVESEPVRRALWSDAVDDEEEVATASSFSSVSTSASAAMQELAALRAENANLRNKNTALELRAKDAVQRSQVQLPEDLLDNPYEPPPQVWCNAWGCPASPAASTVAHSFCSGSAEGTSLASSCGPSGTATPVHIGPDGQAFTLVPVGWFALGDRGQIPNGLVQQARAVFERHTAIPNWFSQQ
eukprot:gb/GFBE01067809.1/.p1 GENE.gb/GFBE01067809.1/~~gb/GFBE01067809.1/.p1  ORF type:complete len:408 (+),score=90.46 gb/GFBE01067809.1/:1-1224(+)